MKTKTKRDWGEHAPSEIQVIPFGKHETDRGVFVLDEGGMAAVVADFDARANDMVIDYEHQSLAAGEAPAAGWIKRLVNKGKDGLWAVVEWTPRAVEYLKDREYRYLSPVFLKSLKDHRVVGLVNAALTNRPAIDGMEPVLNKKPETGNRKPENTNKEVAMKKLLEALGLGEDAAEERALGAVKRLRALEAAVLEALGLGEEASLSEITGALEALRKGHEMAGELARKAAGCEEALREKEAGELVAHAMGEGKVTAAQRGWALDYAGRDPEGFSAFVAKSPVLVPMGEFAGGGYAPGRGSGGVPDEIQRRANRVLGVSEETFRKHNG